MRHDLDSAGSWFDGAAAERARRSGSLAYAYAPHARHRHRRRPDGPCDCVPPRSRRTAGHRPRSARRRPRPRVVARPVADHPPHVPVGRLHRPGPRVVPPLGRARRRPRRDADRADCGGLDFGPPDAKYMAEMRASMELAQVPVRRRRRRRDPPPLPAAAARPRTRSASTSTTSRCSAPAAASPASPRRRAPPAPTSARASPSPASHPDGDGVLVATDAGDVAGDACVIANGAWIGPLLARRSA